MQSTSCLGSEGFFSDLPRVAVHRLRVPFCDLRQDLELVQPDLLLPATQLLRRHRRGSLQAGTSQSKPCVIAPPATALTSPVRNLLASKPVIVPTKRLWLQSNSKYFRAIQSPTNFCASGDASTVTTALSAFSRAPFKRVCFEIPCPLQCVLKRFLKGPYWLSRP